MTTKDNDHPINPIRIGDISNDFWRPKEIAQRLPEVTVRQIADLAEKEIITPAIDAAGAGTSRIYDNVGLYSMVVALSARDYLKHIELRLLLRSLLNEELNGKNIPIMCLLNWKKDGTFEADVISRTEAGKSGVKMLEKPWAVESIKEYSRHLINLHAIKYDLRRSFKKK